MKGSVFFTSTCVICLDDDSIIDLHPCRHVCLCEDCDKEIAKAKMPCPLCRTVIEDREKYSSDEKREEIETTEFFQNERQTYLRELRVKVGSNAGYLGNSAFAQGVRQIFADSFAQAQAEREGTDRVMARSVEFEDDEEKNCVQVSYKLKGKKKPVVEKFSLKEMKFEARAVEEPLTVLELATECPAQYWSWYRKFDGAVEKALQEHGLLQVKRRRRRK